ncbi:MAG: ATP synthase F1 subunit delta [Candidatus Paceibacterota bacterium]|jgi:F-type H+-transporting ATPase subunit delta
MKKVATKQLAKVLLTMTDGKTETESKKAVSEFAEYLGKNGMMSALSKISKEYGILYNKKHTIVEATITLVKRLPERTRILVRESIKNKYKAREVHILEKVDERLIGGMKIQVEDTIWDSSIKNSLSQLEVQLMK